MEWELQELTFGQLRRAFPVALWKPSGGHPRLEIFGTETFGWALLNIILLGRKSFGVETLRGIRSTTHSKSIHTGDGVSERLRLFLFLRDGSGAAQVSPVIFGGFVQ